jgi:hypothetical protein
MEKLKLKSIYKFRKSCSSSHTEHNKISFRIFGFYNFIWILQGGAKTLKGVKILFTNRPWNVLDANIYALGLHETP